MYFPDKITFLKNLLLSLLLFFTFLTSSFDIFLNIHIGGFNLRFVYLPVILLILIWLARMTHKKNFKLIIPTGSAFLLPWVFLVFVFVPNTPLLSRSIGYAFWLILDVGFVFTLVNLTDENNYENVLKIFLGSYFLMSLVGLLQFLLPILHLPTFYVTQWWIPGKLARINAFNYEPSYFATYLVPGFAISVVLYLKKISLGWKSSFWLLMIISELTALVLCSSRMGYLAIALLILFLIVGLFFRVFLRFSIKKRVLALFLGLVLVIGMVFSFLLTKGGGINRFLSGTGVNGSPAGSVVARLNGMKDTWAVFKKSPIIGYSLGGVAPAIGKLRGKSIADNQDAKKAEGLNIFLEVLAGTGIFGFILFIAYLIGFFWKPVNLKLSDKDRGLVQAMLIAFFLELFLLAQNQNILRPYFWIQLGILSLTLRIVGRRALVKEVINENRD